MYKIDELCQKALISQQTFYRLVKTESELREIVEKNREKKGNSYRYGEPVLSWLMDYSGIKSESSQQQPPEQATESAETAAPPPPVNSNEQELKAQIKALEAKIESLTAQLEEKEQERKFLFMQNGNLLMLLTKEKEEKQALLPAPRPPLRERIRSVFSKQPKKQEQP